jgi:hypothetical protein
LQICYGFKLNSHNKTMKTLRLVLIVIALTSFIQSAKSQTFTNACYVASTGRIWEATGGCGYYIIGCDPYGDFTTITATTTINCTPCGGGPTGKRVTINVVPCPIDSYVWLLITGVSGVFFFKRKIFFAN